MLGNEKNVFSLLKMVVTKQEILRFIPFITKELKFFQTVKWSFLKSFVTTD